MALMTNIHQCFNNITLKQCFNNISEHEDTTMEIMQSEA